MTQKFKVGDIVRPMRSFTDDEFEHTGWQEEMEHFIGKELTVSDVCDYDLYAKDGNDSYGWWWPLEVLELVVERKKSAEEIAPTLWEAYKDVLNEEALAALRQVIEDVDSHEHIVFADTDSIQIAFVWEYTTQGNTFWKDVCFGKYDKKDTLKGVAVASVVEPLCAEPFQAANTGSAATSIKSDGGSSDYYKITVKTPHGLADVEVNDLIYALVGGDFDLGNVVKASRRMFLASKGIGKEGVDIEYDVNKCKWFLDDFQMRFGKEKQQ